MSKSKAATAKPIKCVLGFETSCDETAVALYHVEHGLLAQKIYSQIELHKEYGGVVPELAARDHIQYALPLLHELLHESDYNLAEVDAIAYTKGPGLVGALLVGAALARSLAWALSIPSVGVHHMEAHLAAIMLEDNAPDYPYLALLVSGGHTMLVTVTALGHYQILGETLDDAVGEAFDKTAKVLGLSYPGGPAVASAALDGDPTVYKFPRPMVRQGGLDFSFSGLKTAVLNCWQQSDKSVQTRANIARAFEEAVVDTLLIKIKRALGQSALQKLVVVGGVSANQRLRQSLQQQLQSQQIAIYFPSLQYCTDNAAMVACLGAKRLVAGEREPLAITVKPRWSMADLQPPDVAPCD